MANKKSGQIAVPFLVTIFVGLIIIGGFAYGLYRYFGFGKEDAPPEPTPRQGTQITYEDNHTVLLILDEPELQRCNQTFLLMRSIPVKKQLIFIGLPSNMISIVDGQQQSLIGAFEQGGPSAAADYTGKVFGITVDRYIKLESDSFKKICDIFGGVTYSVNADIGGFKNDGSQQYMNSEQMELYVTYPLFADGESERAFSASSLISAMVNQADGKRIADSFDSSFNTIINMVTETNISAIDYKKRKAAIKNMFENGTTISISLYLDGSSADEDYIPSSDFIASLRSQYFDDSQLDQ